MISNTDIIDKMQADSLFGVRLDKALSGVKDEVLEQANRIQLGARRLMFYTSCFTENYQDVCKDQKHEYVRFMEAIGQLVKERDVVKKMLEIYVKQLLQGLTSERIMRIKVVTAKFRCPPRRCGCFPGLLCSDPQMLPVPDRTHCT